MLDIKKIIF
jgi:general stress protein CsbA